MKKYDTLFIDRDGTLNPDPGYIQSLDQFEFYPFALPALKRLAEAGNRFCIISNQSGIGRGIIKTEKLEEIHDFIRREFEKIKLPLLDIYFCPDHPNEATEFRKPGPGMFLKAAEDHDLVLKDSLMIGDAVSDIEAGVNLKMDTMLVLSGKGVETADRLKRIRPTFIAADISDGTDLILGDQ